MSRHCNACGQPEHGSTPCSIAKAVRQPLQRHEAGPTVVALSHPPVAVLRRELAQLRKWVAEPTSLDWYEAVLDRMEAAEADRDRLRARTHEIAEAADKRYAPYVRRCADWDNWAEFARNHFADWRTRYSAADAQAIMEIIGRAETAETQRDELVATLKAAIAALAASVAVE